MKKWGFLLFLLTCLGFTFVHVDPFSESIIEIESSNQGDNRDTQELEISREQIYQGNLLLVNNEYPVQQNSIKSDIVDLSERQELTGGYILLGSEIYLSERIASEFSKMIEAAEKEGLYNFAITSGFRSFEEQEILYQQMGSSYALPPGYSEHNLGLSLDVGSTQMKMADAPEGRWMEENSWKYGFIMRYPKDKTDVTGIQYEPWHIRYVGLPHSAIMHEKNLALEEYLDFLKEEQTISATLNGVNYSIAYYPISQNRTIRVPENSRYEISGNNVDGVIVTALMNS